MKKLGKIQLQNALVLEEQEMKRIYGGSGGSGGDCCAYSTSGSGSSFTCLAYGGNPSLAEFMAGSSGWWGCNSSTIKNFCGC